MLVAGKGHEKIQVIKDKKTYFSDKKIILKSIRIKNSSLSNDIKLNILKEKSNNKNLSLVKDINQARLILEKLKKTIYFLQLKVKEMMEINMYQNHLKKRHLL